MDQHLNDLRGEDSRSSSDSSEEDWLSEAVALRRNLTDAFDRQFTEPSSIVAQSSQTHSISDRISHFEEGKRAVMTKPPMIPNRMIANNNIPADRFAVYLRIRPPSSYGKEKKQVSESNTIEILQPSESQTFPTKVRTYPPADSQTSKFNINLEGHGATSSAKEFEFHQVLAPTTTQQDLYSVVAAPLIQSLFQNSKSIEKKSNRNATLQKSALLFSYGITNSGKTHTILGKTKTNDSAGWGVIPRAISDIFNRMNNGAFELYISCFELYNEQLFDLLPAKTSNQRIGPPPGLKVRESRGQILVRGLTKNKVKSVKHGIDLTNLANTKRHTSSNNLNVGSSRSHFICQLQILPLKSQENHSEDISVTSMSGYSTDEEASIVKSKNISTFWIVDLAGSERSKRTGMGSSRQKEASIINKSLLTLMRCLTVMRESGRQNTSHIIPFRESKLTHLFMGHLTSPSASRTTMVVNVNPAIADFDETQHVLSYASKAKTIQMKPEELNKKRKQYFGDEYDMNGRKKSKKISGNSTGKNLLSRVGLSSKNIVRKLSPKKIFRAHTKKDSSPISKEKIEEHRKDAKPVFPRHQHMEEFGKLKKALIIAKTEISDLTTENSHLIDTLQDRERQIGIAKSEIEYLKREISELSDDLQDQERQIRLEVSEEIEERLKKTRAMHNEELERLKSRIQANSNLCRSAQKPQMDFSKTKKKDLKLPYESDDYKAEIKRLHEKHESEIADYKDKIAKLMHNQIPAVTEDSSDSKVAQLEKELAERKTQISYLERSKAELIESYEKLLNDNDGDDQEEDEVDGEITFPFKTNDSFSRPPLGDKMGILNKNQLQDPTSQMKTLPKESQSLNGPRLRLDA